LHRPTIQPPSTKAKEPNFTDSFLNIRTKLAGYSLLL